MSNSESIHDKEYYNLIHNKRVIFVGPARILMGKNKGLWVDSFDVILRTNGAFPVDVKLQKDYGKRCDVLFVNAQFVRETKLLPVELYRNNGLKFLNFKTGVPDLKNNEYEKFVKCVSFIAEIRELQQNINGLLSGMAILRNILKRNPKELWITGITSYSEGQWNWEKNYINDYLPGEALRKAKIKLKEGKLVPHDLNSNNEYLFKLYESGKVKIDDDVLNILGWYK